MKKIYTRIHRKAKENKLFCGKKILSYDKKKVYKTQDLYNATSSEHSYKYKHCINKYVNINLLTVLF